MIAARKQFEEALGLGLVRRLFQQAAPQGDDGVGGQDDGVGRARGHHLGLAARQALGQTRRRLVLQRRLVDVGGINMIGNHPDLRQKLNPARARRGQNQPRSRKVRTRHARPYLKR
ncbi:hypothetical protein D3C78_1519200 [compost metagenome]